MLNNGVMGMIVLLLVLGQAGAQATDTAVGPADAPEQAPITIQEVKTPAVRVFHLNVPWGPETFAAMERPGDSFYNRRSWPFARMETTRDIEIDDTPLPPGNYALVFHPNTPDDQGMSLEIRRIAPGEFLQKGNVMTRTPDGETVWQAPVTFQTVSTTLPSLEIGLTPDPGGLRLDVRYGNRRTHRVFRVP
jgi:hypothetical protein